MIQTTIVALATPPFQSAIALIRVSGPLCPSLLHALFSKPLAFIETRKATVGTWYDEFHSPIDQVVVTTYSTPKSYTGEDMLEITSHGNMYITNRIIASLVAQGCVLADRGEFTQRAFLNSKIDLIQAESIHDLINADSRVSHQLALANLGGKASGKIATIKTALQDIRAHIEVNIDYPEYHDIEQITHDIILPRLSDIAHQMNDVLSDARIGKVITNGLKTAIVGQTNVGKSSLLNSLLNENKAIVTEIAGTTRDIVEGRVQLGGITLHLMDTAGIRDTTDTVENIGVSKSLAAILEAELIIVVLDASRPLDDQDKKVIQLTDGRPRIIVSNKTDLSKKYVYPGSVEISAKNRLIKPLEDAIYHFLGFNPLEVVNRPLLTNARQEGLLSLAFNQIQELIQSTKVVVPLDLLSVDLGEVIRTVQSLLGEEVNDQMDKEIFSRFCIGK